MAVSSGRGEGVVIETLRLFGEKCTDMERGIQWRLEEIETALASVVN